MGESHARVVATAPPESAIAHVAEPVLAGGSGATVTQWDAARTASGDVLLVGCVATPIPGWVEDMRPTVEARTTALMTSGAERAAGVPIEARAHADHLELRYSGGGEEAARAGVGRTFVGWEDGAVATCFASCTTAVRSGASAAAGRACDATVMNARLEGGTRPPPPGIVLGAVTWGVHHPTTTVAWGGVLAFTLGVVAVVSRRRPRSRI